MPAQSYKVMPAGESKQEGDDVAGIGHAKGRVRERHLLRQVTDRALIANKAQIQAKIKAKSSARCPHYMGKLLQPESDPSTFQQWYDATGPVSDSSHVFATGPKHGRADAWA